MAEFLPKFLMATFIYRLVVRNHDFDAFLKEILFLVGNGRGRHGGAEGSVTSGPDLLGQPLSRKHVFKLFGPEVGETETEIWYPVDSSVIERCRNWNY